MIPRKGIAQPQSQFPHSCVCERLIYSQDRSANSAAGNRMWMDRSWENINHSQTHECENQDWGRAIPFLAIHKWDFRCSVCWRQWRKPKIHPWIFGRILPGGCAERPHLEREAVLLCHIVEDVALFLQVPRHSQQFHQLARLLLLTYMRYDYVHYSVQWKIREVEKVTSVHPAATSLNFVFVRNADNVSKKWFCLEPNKIFKPNLVGGEKELFLQQSCWVTEQGSKWNETSEKSEQLHVPGWTDCFNLDGDEMEYEMEVWRATRGWHSMRGPSGTTGSSTSQHHVPVHTSKYRTYPGIKHYYLKHRCPAVV